MNRKKLGRYLLIVALAELPAILAIVYVVTGGDRNHAHFLGALTIAMLLAFPHHKAGVGR